MKKIMASVLLLAASFVVNAQEWVVVAENQKSSHSVKVNSFSSNTVDGVQYYSAVMSAKSKLDNLNQIEVVAVSRNDCASEVGKLHTIPIEDPSKKYANGFAFGSGTIASNIAEVICRVGSRMKAQGLI